MRIAVVGAGALGTLFGGLLAGDHEVWLLHHSESTASVLRDRGVRIEHADGVLERAVRATADAAAVGMVDLVLVLVKAHQTRAAISDHRACIGPETRVLTLQNGLGPYEAVIDAVGAERALGGVTYHGVERVDTGVVIHNSTGETVFGPDTAAAKIRTAFEGSGIEPVGTVPDPRRPIWEKQLVGIATKPLAALTGLPNGRLVADDRLRLAMEQLVTEGAAVARAEGVELDAAEQFESVCELLSGSEHRSSMLQDVAAGRPTEIGSINGAVVDRAEEASIEVPYNRFVTALVRAIEGEGCSR